MILITVQATEKVLFIMAVLVTEKCWLGLMSSNEMPQLPMQNEELGHFKLDIAQELLRFKDFDINGQSIP